MMEPLTKKFALLATFEEEEVQRVLDYAADQSERGNEFGASGRDKDIADRLAELALLNKTSDDGAIATFELTSLGWAEL